MPEGNNYKTLSFKSEKSFETWLEKNHHKVNGIWLKIFKKDSGEKTITYNEALETAICYGWIDGLKKTYDKKSWIQKFTPRRLGSMWSKRNTEIAERLLGSGRMKAAGLKEIEAAKQDGRWEKAYDSQSNMSIPQDFLNRLFKNKKAKKFFETLNKTNLYSIGYRLQTAKKPETREKRVADIIQMLAEGRKFH